MTDEYSDPTYGYGELLGGGDAATAETAPASDPTYGYGELLGSDDNGVAEPEPVVADAPDSDPTYGYGALFDAGDTGDTGDAAVTAPGPDDVDATATNDYGYGALFDAAAQADTIDQTADAIVNAVDNAVHLPTDDAPTDTDYGYAEVLASDAPPPDIKLPDPLPSDPNDFATPTLMTLALHGRDGGTTDPAAFLVEDGPVNFVTVTGADIRSDGHGDIALPIDSRLINMNAPDDAALLRQMEEQIEQGQVPPEQLF
jgi:hypothetical protein